MRRTRKCNKCGKEKKINEYYYYKDPGSHTKDGYDYTCKLCTNEENRRYYAANKDKKRKYHREWQLKVLKVWERIIPKKTKCQICGKTIYFSCGEVKDSICFDHRTGKEPIKVPPSMFLRKKKWNKDREKLWLECNFGMLCWWCNRRLPTKNRKKYLLEQKKWIENCLNYLNGEKNER